MTEAEGNFGALPQPPWTESNVVRRRSTRVVEHVLARRLARRA